MNLAQSFTSKISTRFPNSVENEPEFIQMVVDHFPHIREDTTRFASMEVTADIAAIYIGDFHGLLMKKGCEPRHNTINTLFNHLIKSSDYTGEPGHILFIEPEFIAKLKKTYTTKRR